MPQFFFSRNRDKMLDVDIETRATCLNRGGRICQTLVRHH